jgi:ribonuclease-3
MLFSETPRYKQLRQFIQKLGLSEQALVQLDLLDLALTHPTASPEVNYERLEFVGDAVVKLAAAEFLHERYPHASEGELSAIRAILVSDRHLAEIADCYGLERYLLVGSSARGDRIGNETRLASGFEAVLAALYLSTHTLELIRPWLDAHLAQKAEAIRLDPTMQNYKGALQTWTQAKYQTLPEYRVVEVGQAYGDTERFLAEVWLNGQKLGQGKGKSKKTAEQAAAQVAFLALQQSVS